MHERLRAPVSRLEDARSRRVVFLTHCLVSENARYLGGACRRCCASPASDYMTGATLVVDGGRLLA